MPKTIVFCADGTWNGPEEPDDGHAPGADAGGLAGLTNVCKSFAWLDGVIQPSGEWGGVEMEKILNGADGEPVQIAKYIHGVGNSTDRLDELAGGAFGVGVVARIARGYTFISRNYQPGDKIVIIGFSRGAYTARALAGLIAGQGLLAPQLASATDNDRYDTAAHAWFRWRRSQDTIFQRIVDGVIEFTWLREAFPNPKKLDDHSFVPATITAVAVWDTVGEMGIPVYDKGAAIDLFEFCNTKLSPSITLGIHAVAMDEERIPFTPTLWTADPRVEQVIFPGGHCDIGGGYADHGLSDGPLLWMVDRLEQPDVGVKFGQKPPVAVTPDPLGPRHRQWMEGKAWALVGVGRRKFPTGIPVDASVQKRMNGKAEDLFLDPANTALYDPGYPSAAPISAPSSATAITTGVPASAADAPAAPIIVPPAAPTNPPPGP